MQQRSSDATKHAARDNITLRPSDATEHVVRGSANSTARGAADAAQHVVRGSAIATEHRAANAAEHASRNIFDLDQGRRQHTRMSAHKANKLIIKHHRQLFQQSSNESTAAFINVTDQTEWQRLITFHSRASEICRNGGGIVGAYVASLEDEWDHNHQAPVVDLILICIDGTHVRLHPNKQNPTYARAGYFQRNPTLNRQFGFGAWEEHAFQDLPHAGNVMLQSTLSLADAPIPAPGHSQSCPAWQVYRHPQNQCLWWQCDATGEVQTETPPPGWSVFTDIDSGRCWCADNNAIEDTYYWM